MTKAFRSLETDDGICSIPENPNAISPESMAVVFADPPDPVVEFPRDTPIFVPPLFAVGCTLPDVAISDDRCRPGGLLTASVTVEPGVGEDPCAPVINLDLHADLICTSTVISATVNKRLHPQARPHMAVESGATAPDSGECSQTTCLKISLPDVTCAIPTFETKRIAMAGIASQPQIRFDVNPTPRPGYFEPNPPSSAFPENICLHGPGVPEGQYNLSGERDGHPVYSQADACGYKVYFDQRIGKYVISGQDGKITAWGEAYLGEFFAYYPDDWCLPEDETACETSSSLCGPPPAERVGASVRCPPDPSQPAPAVFNLDEDPCSQLWALDIVMPNFRCESPDIHPTIVMVDHDAEPELSVTTTPVNRSLPLVDDDGFPVRDDDGELVNGPQDDPCTLRWDLELKLPEMCVSLPAVETTVIGDGRFEVQVEPGIKPGGGIDVCNLTWKFNVVFPGFEGDGGGGGGGGGGGLSEDRMQPAGVKWDPPYLYQQWAKYRYSGGRLIKVFAVDNADNTQILRAGDCP